MREAIFGEQKHERGTHIDECSICSSNAVFHDVGASGDVEQWYDCLNCGTRLMLKWKSNEPSLTNLRDEQEVSEKKVSDGDFEWDDSWV